MDISHKITPYMRAVITVAVMTATLLQVLDTTIVNVALPHMEGSLSATPDQVTWVLTSYLVASAIFMPLTGYFTDLLGQRKYLLISIGGFVLASALCGIADSITQIVIFRLLQGVFGAALVPLSQSIMVDIFPAEERGFAMALWSAGVMVGPIIGPTLGGYLTDMATWRWNFYINVPIGILCMLLTWHVLPDTEKKSRDMDWLGLGLISVAIGAFQYLIDRGNSVDWFSSRAICVAAFLSVVSMLWFILHNIDKKNKTMVFDLTIFLDRNFAIASVMLALFGLGLYGAMVILPLMLEGLFNYPVVTTGLVMAPRGVSSMISMLTIGYFIKNYDPRRMILLGISVCCVGMYFGMLYSQSISPMWIVGPNILQGFGLGMVFVPLSTVAFSTLPARLRPEAAGLYSLLRTMGGSVGISIISTLVTRKAQVNWNQLGGFVNPYNTALYQYFTAMHIAPTSRLGVAILMRLVQSQAQMIAFINGYAFIMVSFLMMVPLVFLLKEPKRQGDVAAVHIAD